MGTWASGTRPITIAILAMGGEGGGVLSDWIVSIGERAGFTAQSTSVAGVAQRTGATIYYVELFAPDPSAHAGRGTPVLSTMATPGEVDIVIASELMEAGRAIQRGLVTADRTTLVASTNRVYSMSEKMAPGDGRVDSEQLLASARAAAKTFIGADFGALAEAARSVISSALLGALAGSGALPFTREQFEAAITEAGKGVETSLAAFASGYDAAVRPAPAVAAPARVSNPVPIEIGRRPASLDAASAEVTVGPALRSLADRAEAEFPAAARRMLLLGLRRTALFQDLSYAERYLARVARLAALEPAGATTAALTEAGARHVALWMCYQDTIQVAFQKTRPERFDRVRDEARAADGQIVQVREFLHPQLEEITDTMPTGMGSRLARSGWFARVVHRLTRKGMVVQTTSVSGYTKLSLLARLRPLRPRSLRFGREQAAIDAWLDRVVALAARDYDLAVEVLECQRVLKGYGETHERGTERFHQLVAAADDLVGQPDAAARLADLRNAALADENGAELEAKLAQLTPA